MSTLLIKHSQSHQLHYQGLALLRPTRPVGHSSSQAWFSVPMVRSLKHLPSLFHDVRANETNGLMFPQEYGGEMTFEG